jgi:hypothetical protein
MYGIIIATIYSCNIDSDKKSITTNPKKYSSVVNRFYTYYISEYNRRKKSWLSPEIINISDTTYCLNKKAYIDTLKILGYFSSKFIFHESEKIKKCNQELSKIVWINGMDGTFDFLPSCDFCWVDNWIFGQGEEITGFEIVSEKIEKDNIAKISVEFFSDNSSFSKANITVIKETDGYKIDSIYLFF